MPTPLPAGLPADLRIPAVAIPSGDELYDLLMSQIEPELTRAMLPTLEEKYADETSEQSQARAKRYEAAFAEYQKRLDAYLLALRKELEDQGRIARKQAEHRESEDDQSALAALEEKISHDDQ